MISSSSMGYIKHAAVFLLHKSFFAGYDPLLKDQADQKTELLIKDFQAHRLFFNNSIGQPLDALSFKKDRESPSRGVIVFAETTSYQDRLYKQIPHQVSYFLNCGFEVIFWNPSTPQFTTKQYATDLASLLKQVKTTTAVNIPLLVKAHCASVEPTIHASTTLSDFEQKSVVLILDRGYADATYLARSTTVLCNFSWIWNLIKQLFACNGINKFKQFAGKVILIAPEDVSADQIMYWPKTGQNLTKMMQDIRQNKEDASIGLGANSDHWSHWDQNDYAKITAVLKRMGLISEKEWPEIPDVPQRGPISWGKRVIIPYLLTKAWL